jgi:hypothetical protein
MNPIAALLAAPAPAAVVPVALPQPKSIAALTELWQTVRNDMNKFEQSNLDLGGHASKLHATVEKYLKPIVQTHIHTHIHMNTTSPHYTHACTHMHTPTAGHHPGRSTLGGARPMRG